MFTAVVGIAAGLRRLSAAMAAERVGVAPPKTFWYKGALC
jgi:hypothetical protein